MEVPLRTMPSNGKGSRMSIDSQVARLRRRLSRWRLEPAARGQARSLGRQSASTDETSGLPTSQWYRGYSDDDLSVFDGFPPVPGKSQSGFIVDFLGVRTRVAHAAPFASFDGKVFSTPVPVGDWFHAETIEYVGLLKCVVTAKDRFVALELGAGWGPWLVSGAKAARRRGIKDIRLHGIEGDPEHFASMQTHFRDNGLDPAAHRLDNAAVGVTAGRARWPKSANPSADFALRPLVPSGEDASEARDATTSDYRGAIFDGYIDVEMFSLQSVLERESQWDLVHIDVQGGETELCSAAVETLNQRVRWLIIGTHSRKIDGDLIDLFLRNGWILENEKPARFEFRVEAPSLEAMTVVDGTQVWRNPRH
jgi:FkbM family methyltransferase